MWKDSFKIISKIKKNLNNKGKIIIFDAFNKYNLNTVVKTISTLEKEKYVETYFYNKDYFIKKLNLGKKFSYKYMPMKFKSLKKKRKVIWNESFAIKMNNKIKYLRPDNYLLDQCILVINKN